MSAENVLVLIGLVPAAVLVARTFILVRRLRRFLARATRTSGRITRHTLKRSPSSRGSAKTWHYPHVEFSLEDGSLVEFLSSQPEVRPFGAGAEVRVAYDPANPTATALIEGDLAWHPARQSGCVAVPAVFVAILVVLARVCG